MCVCVCVCVLVCHNTYVCVCVRMRACGHVGKSRQTDLPSIQKVDRPTRPHLPILFVLKPESVSFTDTQELIKDNSREQWSRPVDSLQQTTRPDIHSIDTDIARLVGEVVVQAFKSSNGLEHQSSTNQCLKNKC